MRNLADMVRGFAAETRVSGGPGLAQVGARPLGTLSGAPPRVNFRTYMVIPGSSVGVNGVGPTLVVAADAASRLVIFMAPLIGFSVFIGPAGVRTDPGASGIALLPALPYEVVIPGGQEIYAVTDAPTYIPLRVQEAPLLIGDRERG